MKSILKQVLLLCLVPLALCAHVTADPVKTGSARARVAPFKNLRNDVTEGTGTKDVFSSESVSDIFDEVKGGGSKVSVMTVGLFTLAMAAASGFGAVPFFFVELDPQWAGLCNGMAAGVMLAASFDLIQEGQDHGNGNLVVIGILAGGIFIAICKKVLDQYGEVSMLDIKGADAAKVVLVVGIMTLHAFGEGAGVGVSFAGSKGITHGLLVTLAIAVHNIPEGLAVSMVLSSRGVSPQNAMIWSILTSLPQVKWSFFSVCFIFYEMCLVLPLYNIPIKMKFKCRGVIFFAYGPLSSMPIYLLRGKNKKRHTLLKA